jgi:putative membrane protein
MTMAWNPAALLYLLGAVLLYGRAVRVLRGRGQRVPTWQQAAWYGGLALTAFALISPVDSLGEELLTMHMGQHLLLADLAAPLMIVGLRNPVLAFVLPPAVLVPLARSRLRRVFRALRQPAVALVVFVVLLYGWHLRVLFEAALRSDAIHALQHMSFAGSLLVWWAVLEPKRRRMPGELGRSATPSPRACSAPCWAWAWSSAARRGTRAPTSSAPAITGSRRSPTNRRPGAS